MYCVYSVRIFRDVFGDNLLIRDRISQALEVTSNQIPVDHRRRHSRMFYVKLRACVLQSCPWVGLTRGLGWVGSGSNGSKIFVFSGLGWVIGLKWQMCEKYMSCVYVTLYRVNAGKFVFFL